MTFRETCKYCKIQTKYPVRALRVLGPWFEIRLWISSGLPTTMSLWRILGAMGCVLDVRASATYRVPLASVIVGGFHTT
jgi:hypothetical protein